MTDSMNLPDHKTKIVCTLGPASEDRRILEKMLHAGMDIARLNFSHGDFESHGRMVESLRAAAQSAGKRVAILADLPGPKIRIGRLAEEPVVVATDSVVTLTTKDFIGNSERISVNFPDLPKVVKKGDTLFINDGFLQLEVIRKRGSEVSCRVTVGGELGSGKGLNLPGIRLGIGAFTENDRRCLEFALKLGVDAVSQSFVETAEDIGSVRRAAAEMGYSPFLFAKIERARALEHIEPILDAADGILIGRGDLGVEIPVERIAIVQKRLVQLANRAGKPVITATHMLESMTHSSRPTRAEATDVANAILDGTDCVMLSGESAMGRYPVKAVDMLSRIAAETEPKIPIGLGRDTIDSFKRKGTVRPKDLIALSLGHMMDHVSPAALLVPTQSGATAQNIARFRLPVWVTAVSSRPQTCQILQFSYGIFPVYEPEPPEDWRRYSQSWLQSNGIRGDIVLLIEGPSPRNPTANHRLEIIDMKRPDAATSFP